MNEVIEKEEKNITSRKDISDSNAPKIYGVNGLDVFYEEAKKQVDEVPDLSTSAGRKRIASLSGKVSSSKVAVVEPGRKYAQRIKALPKKIEAELREFESKMDDLRDETRKPLTDWENAEADRINREAEEAEAEKMRVERESHHYLAIFMDEKFDNDAILAKQEAERVEAETKRIAAELAVQVAAEKEAERIVYEAKIREEAKAQAEQETRQAQEREAAYHQKAIDAENLRVEQEKRATINAENARIASEKREIEAAENARIAEVNRQVVLKRIEAKEQAAIMANKAHIGKIRKEAKQSLMDSIGLDEVTAKNIVLAINSGSIRHVSIKYWE